MLETLYYGGFKVVLAADGTTVEAFAVTVERPCVNGLHRRPLGCNVCDSSTRSALLAQLFF